MRLRGHVWRPLWFALAWFLPLNASPAAPPEGLWDAFLETPGGPLYFGLQLSLDGDRWTAQLQNGPDSVDVPKVTFENERLVLSLIHYDSVIDSQWDNDRGEFSGSWTKRRGADLTATLPFSARRASSAPRDVAQAFAPPAEAFLGRWSVRYAADPQAAIGDFRRDHQGKLWGTFLTPLGDYRYLSGRVVKGQLELSCFDGGHAFLFRCRVEADQTLRGDFWSGDWWHDQWTARRDAQAALPDALTLTKVRATTQLRSLEFPDLQGRKQKILSAAREGKPLLIEIFGSWCPNCHDAGAFLGELEAEYASQDLKILGLAFELTGDAERDTRQVREYVTRHQLTFPVFLAGTSNKKEATARLQILEEIKAYPTFLFVDRRGEVRAVYTGFYGPATGAAHHRMREQFESPINEIVAP